MSIYNTRYGRKYGLSLPMVNYLNQPLPDISGIFAPLAGTAPVIDVPIEDVTEDEILQAIAAQDYYNQINQGGGGDGSDVFNVRPGDPNIRFPNQYSPYAYRQAAESRYVGDLYPTETGLQKQMSMYPDYYGVQGRTLTGIEQLMSKIPTPLGFVKKGLDAISNALPVNPRAIKENELLGAGVALDPIGRVVQTGDYLDPTNVMAGYNAAKITDETVDERIETINESLNKFDKYDPFSPSYDPEATQYQLDKIKALEEFKTDILDPSTEKTKNVLQSEYETDPKYQFTGPNVQGDFKTTNNVAARESAIAQEAANREAVREAAAREAEAKKNFVNYLENFDNPNYSYTPSGSSDTADDFDDGTMTGKAATSTGKTGIDSFFDAVDKTATKGGGATSGPSGTISDAQAEANRDAARGGQTGGGGGGDGCFLKGTLVTMLDGSKKEIQEIDLGDEVAKGGKVFATGKFLVNNLYDYRGIKVSGSHMVFEEGNWTRVEDSKYGKALGDEEHTVYVFGCENRRILIEDILFTDYFEVKDQDKLIEDKEKFFDNWKTFANNEDRKNVNTLNAN